MKNLYEILGVSPNATNQEIKKAYNKLLRKYPPEKETEKYKEIREAYDTLKDNDSRKNYDAYFQYGNEITLLEKEANEFIEKEEYSKAETTLKKILIISPNILHIRVLLGNLFFKESKYNDSIKIFDKLIEEYPNNSDYYLKRGKSYEELKNFTKAKIDYLKSYSLDYGNLNAIGSIVYLYFEEAKIDSAISFLEKEIYRDNSLDFEDFFCLSKLIECYVLKNDRIGLQKTINMIKKIAPNDKETKDYMAWKLAKLASSIEGIKFYILAYDIAYLAHSLTPENETIINYTKNLYLYKLTEELMEDTTITFKPMIGPIFYYMHGDNYSKEDREKNMNAIIESLKTLEISDIKRMITSLEIIIKNYNPLYLERKEIYDNLKIIINDKLERLKEIKRFISDSRIDSGFKHCILALEMENSEAFSDGFEKIKNSKIIDIKNSIQYFQNYSKLYDKHIKFVSSIREAVNSNTSSSKEGCYIATAVYGNYDAEEVLILRKFRDTFLKKYFLGRSFIKFYYTISPSLAKKLKPNNVITKFIKKILDKFVTFLETKYN